MPPRCRAAGALADRRLAVDPECLTTSTLHRGGQPSRRGAELPEQPVLAMRCLVGQQLSLLGSAVGKEGGALTNLCADAGGIHLHPLRHRAGDVLPPVVPGDHRIDELLRRKERLASLIGPFSWEYATPPVKLSSFE